MTLRNRSIPLLSAILLLALGLAAWLKVPKKTGAISVTGDSTFPTVTGTNLDRVDLEFPRDFAKPYNIVFVPFQQWQQRQVDSWVPFVQELEANRDDIIYYEFPTVWEMGAAQRTFLNEGMRAGIPNQTSRERTVTLYLDKAGFRSQLDIPNEETTYIFIVKQSGEVVGRVEGAFSAEKAQQLSLLLDSD